MRMLVQTVIVPDVLDCALIDSKIRGARSVESIRYIAILVIESLGLDLGLFGGHIKLVYLPAPLTPSLDVKYD